MMSVLRETLDILTNTRVGIAVMAILAVLCLLGATIPQGGSQADYIEVYGRLRGGAIWALGLADVFRASYFTALLVLLCVMVCACSLKRLPQSIRLASEKSFVFEEKRVRGMPQSADLTVDVDAEEATLHAIDIARRHLYAVSRAGHGHVSALFATKAAFSRYGSTMLHLSFIFLLAGGIAVTRFGWHAYREVSVGTEFALTRSGADSVAVRVDDFDIDYDERGNISDYVCRVSVEEGGAVALKYSIRPNHPLRLSGREVYLNSYREDPQEAQGFAVTVYDSLGNAVIPHLYIPMGKPVYLDELKAVARADMGVVPSIRVAFDDGTIETHPIRLSLAEPGDGGSGYTFVLMYVVPSVIVILEIVREPGQWLIITGLALLTLGAFMSLYLSHRRIWIIVMPLADAKARVVAGGSASRNREAFGREFGGIMEALNELA
jgi:cytochrome c biogenesis protein